MDNLNIRGTTFNHVNATLIHTAGAAKTFATAVTSACSIRGKFAVALAAGVAKVTPVLDAQTGVEFVALGINRATVLVWGVNAAGAAVLAQGTIEPTAPGVGAVAGDFITVPQFPTLPADFCPIAYQLIRTAPTAASFIIGTSNWNATGVTVSVAQNVSVLPTRPQTA